MACRGIAALAADPAIEVVCMVNPANRPLVKKLAGIETLAPPCTPDRLKSINPDLVLCIQGDIAQSTQAIHAARKAGIECVSYLAIPHTLKQMGAKLGALRDRTHQHLINQPTRYIVISESMKQRLVKRGCTQPIAIVPNGIVMPHASSLTPHPSSLTTLGLLGRIEFNQKQQDFMVETFGRFPEAFSNCKLLIAGNGPDEDKLRKLIAQSPRRDDIILQPWQSDTEAFYSAIDVLLLPSRFEGVPLVMLEALVRGIPVLGSRCDGMRDILPETWTFEPENGKELAGTFCEARENWTNEIDAVRQRVATETALDTFKTRFRDAVSKPA